MRGRQRTTGATVGIDLGTTFSAMAWVNDLGRPETLPNREGEHITPSVVLFDGAQPLVGTMAKRSVMAAPLDVVQFVKRSMGDPAWRFETDGGVRWRPEEVSALILKRMKEDAERALGTAVTDAVITVPAYFDDAPRRATIDAGRIAGLNVLRVLNEPTAAALAYGVSERMDGRLLVYDLGGGTFDVSVLEVAGGDFRVLATHGDRNLGGFDFDNALIQLLNERFIAAGGEDLLQDDFAEADLRERAEIAKHSLSNADRTRVTLSADGFSTTIPVTRDEFDSVCSSLLSRTRDIAELVLEDAGLAWNKLDRVLLAGGSTRMPMVRAMLTDLAGTAPDLSTNPDETVAHGAAIQAHLLGQEADGQTRFRSHQPNPKVDRREATGTTDVTVHDVTSHGLGIVLKMRGTNKRLNTIVIPPNTPVPASGSVISYTRNELQETITETVTEGDDEDVAYVHILGKQTFSLGRPVPAGTPIKTILHYTVDQIIFVELRWPESDRLIGSFTITNEANMMQAQVAAAASRLRNTAPS